MPVIISSHDRAFLDAVTNRTLFLRPEQSQIFSLPYSRARAALARPTPLTSAVINATQRPPSSAPAGGQAQQYRHQFRQRPAGVEDEAAEAARRKLEDAAKPAHLERSAGAVKLANRGTHAKVLVTLDDAEVRHPTAPCSFGPASSSSARATASCCWGKRRRQNPAGRHAAQRDRQSGNGVGRHQGDAFAGAWLQRPGARRP